MLTIAILCEMNTVTAHQFFLAPFGAGAFPSRSGKEIPASYALFMCRLYNRLCSKLGIRVTDIRPFFIDISPLVAFRRSGEQNSRFRHLFLDEVHKYPHWSKEIKEINDLYPELKITFTGSSLIQILNADADLSRRALSYTMEGLSFREYLHFYKGKIIPRYSLDDILNNADTICEKMNRLCRPQKMFEEYLRTGYYPFYDGSEVEYYSRIENVVNFIIEQEMTEFCRVEPSYTRKLKAMLLFLAGNIPYEVNISKLASYLEISKNTVLSYLDSMKRAELLHLLYADNKTVTKMQKPDKIFIHNPNMLYALANQCQIGTVRECFVVNQLSARHTVEYGKSVGDFKIDGSVTLEVGGEKKTFDQIADIPNSYILADNLEYPVGKKLPLWIVGLNY